MSTQTWLPVHCVHAFVQAAPVVFVFAAQVPSSGPLVHRWKVALQAGTQFVPLQLTVPLVGAVQVVHVGPQASGVSLVTQVGFAVVPRWQ